MIKSSCLTHYLTNSIALWEHLNNFIFSLKKKKNKTVGRRIEKWRSAWHPFWSEKHKFYVLNICRVAHIRQSMQNGLHWLDLESTVKIHCWVCPERRSQKVSWGLRIAYGPWASAFIPDKGHNVTRHLAHSCCHTFPEMTDCAQTSRQNKFCLP